MAEAKSLQDVIQAAVEAENQGVNVDWKAMCFQTYNVAMEEIKRLTPQESDDGASTD